MWEKNSNLDKSNLPESPLTKMTYHVRGCMAFRSNELGFGHDHGIVYRNEAISNTHMALGMAWNAIEADFCFVPQKLYFLFLEC
jgi:hypothetical protein